MSRGKIKLFIFNLGVDKLTGQCYNKGTKNGTRKELTTMIKKTYPITLSYQFDASRKYNKYSTEGEKWMNHGDFCEILAKHCLGFEPKKDANTRFDKGADIPELNASVKSYNGGLADMKLSDDPEIWLNRFWAMSDETQIVIWVFEHGEEVDLWFMSHEEFKEFVKIATKWDNHDKKYRFKTCSNKTNAWLEARL